MDKIKGGEKIQSFKLVYKAFPEEMSSLGVNAFTLQIGQDFSIMIDSSAGPERQDFCHVMSCLILCLDILQ